MDILITGASRGIGSSLAKKMAELTPDLTLFLVSRNTEALEQLKKELISINPGAEVFPFSADLAREEEILELANYVKGNSGKIDILINNAGTIRVKEFSAFSREDIESQFSVNYTAPARLIQHLLPCLSASKAAHVVNISSMAGFQGSKKFPGISHYSASKAAIASLTECLAEEIKGNISFNALCIGAVQTDMLEEAFPGLKAPLSANEMADFMADFALTAHRYMNGKILPVSLVNP